MDNLVTGPVLSGPVYLCQWNEKRTVPKHGPFWAYVLIARFVIICIQICNHLCSVEHAVEAVIRNLARTNGFIGFVVSGTKPIQLVIDGSDNRVMLSIP